MPNERLTKLLLVEVDDYKLTQLEALSSDWAEMERKIKSYEASLRQWKFCDNTDKDGLICNYPTQAGDETNNYKEICPVCDLKQQLAERDREIARLEAELMGGRPIFPLTGEP
jgi:hypothetical protein